MAIPVSNPPPRYEPPAPSEPPSRDEPREPVPFGGGPPPRGAGPAGLSPVARGCMMMLGIAGALVCIASVGLAVSCRGVVQAVESESTHRITVSYRAASVQFNQAGAYAADLDALERLGLAGQLTMFGFTVLNNRYNDAIANDGVIDADELHHGMELVHDVVMRHGDVDIAQYPDAR